MRWLDKIRIRLRTLLRTSQVERELDEEFRFHLDQLTEESIAEGAAPDEARRRALRTLGSLTQFQEECRDMRRVDLFNDFVRDLRYAVRNLSRNPGFAALAVFIMALGIGANTAVFSVVNTVILKPLSYRDPDRIVAVASPTVTGKPAVPLSLKLISIPNFQDWRGQSSSFEAMAYYMSFEASVITGAEAEYARAARVSPEFFRVFAVEPLIGRGFTEDELKLGGGAVMISYGWWQTHYGGDRSVLGRTLEDLESRFPLWACCRRAFTFRIRRTSGIRSIR